MTSPQASNPKRVLFVCLGNICRSPAAEGVFLHLLKSQGLEAEFTVDSAGTGSWHVGKPADGRMRAAASARGIDMPSRARQIERADLERFDLILTMDHDNRHQVQSLAQGLGGARHRRDPLHHQLLPAIRRRPHPRSLLRRRGWL